MPIVIINIFINLNKATCNFFIYNLLFLINSVSFLFKKNDLYERFFYKFAPLFANQLNHLFSLCIPK